MLHGTLRRVSSDSEKDVLCKAPERMSYVGLWEGCPMWDFGTDVLCGTPRNVFYVGLREGGSMWDSEKDILGL